jgi:hypothetical protein
VTDEEYEKYRNPILRRVFNEQQTTVIESLDSVDYSVTFANNERLMVVAKGAFALYYFWMIHSTDGSSAFFTIDNIYLYSLRPEHERILLKWICLKSRYPFGVGNWLLCSHWCVHRPGLAPRPIPIVYGF